MMTFQLEDYTIQDQKDSLYYTHVSCLYKKSKLQLTRLKIEDFWKKYCDFVFEKEDPDVGIAENPNPLNGLQVIGNINIEFPIDSIDYQEGQRLIMDRHIIETIKIFQNELKSLLIEYDDDKLVCFVLEKPSYSIQNKDGEIVKNGFNIYFPYLFLERSDQENFLIPKIRNKLKKSNIFEDLGIKDASKLLDTSYLKYPTLLYGSKKASNMKSYKLTKIIDYDGDEIEIETALRNYCLYDVYERPISLKGMEMYYLPRILSIIPFGRIISAIKKNPIDLPKEIQLKNEIQENKISYRDLKCSENLKKASRLVSILSTQRVNDINIGNCLFNIGNACREALDIWINFCKKSSDIFDVNVCFESWNETVMNSRRIGLSTLEFFAKQDNEEQYEKYINDNIDRYIKDSINGCSHTDIARALFVMYSTEFKCSSIAHGLWYQYDKHRWKKIDSGVTLSMKISDDSSGSLLSRFFEYNMEYARKVAMANDDGEKAMYSVKLKQVQKVISSLKTSPFKKNVMKECMEIFFDDNFLNNLDKNSNLIGFRNGVYDLKQNIFREGLPEDYISLQMPIEYKELKETDKSVLNVYDFFEKIFPDRSIRDYFMDISSEVFVGGNKRKHVYFWSGEGDNGKSVTQMIFEKMLGEYAVKLPTSLIVGKRTQSSAACPELARAGNGVRWAVLQEPDKKDVINIGILKELSGNDTFFARGLYKEGTEIEPMFKLAVICNDPPLVPYSDKATWNRIRVIPFESTFSNNAPSSYEQQLLEKKFPKDPYFDEKIPDMTQALAWILLKHKKSGIRSPEPDKVKIATEFYRKKNDIYRQFMEEKVVEEKSSSLTIAELYTVFKEWYKESLPNQPIPIKNDVKEYFLKTWGETQKGNKWLGYKIQSNDVEDKDDVIEMDDNDFSGRPNF